MANEQKDLGSAIARRETNKVALKQKADIYSRLELQISEYQIALSGDKALAERFVRIVKTSLKNNEKLASCNPLSLLGATMEMAQLHLDPAINEGWLVPYKDRKSGVLNATFQLGVRGLEKLFYRANPDAILEARIVSSVDTFEYCYGMNPELKHIPYGNEDKVDGEPYMIAVYAVATWKNGMKKFEVMTRKAIEYHRDKFSKQYRSAKKYNNLSSSIWHNNFEEMAKNTVIKILLKNLPKSVELETAMRDEDNVKFIPDPREVSASYNILEQPSEPENIADPNEVVIKAEQVEVVTASSLVSEIKKAYKTLMKLLPNDWTEDFIRSHNERHLGITDAKKCDDLDKLKALLTDLESRISKIEQEV